MLSDILKSCGFNEAEASVYEALLMHGPSTPAEISKKVSTSRENTYRILDLLSHKGLVTEVTTSNKLKYFAENPNKLTLLLEKRSKEIKDAKELIDEIAFKIKKDIALSDKGPKLDFLQGEHGVKEAYMASLSEEGGVQYEILDQRWDKYFKKWLDKNFIPTRVNKKIQKRVIVTDLKDEKVSLKSDKNELKESMSIKTDSFPKGSGIIVHGEKTVLISKGRANEDESISIVINHKTISSAIETILELVWNKNKEKITKKQ